MIILHLILHALLQVFLPYEITNEFQVNVTRKRFDAAEPMYASLVYLNSAVFLLLVCDSVYTGSIQKLLGFGRIPVTCLAMLYCTCKAVLLRQLLLLLTLRNSSSNQKMHYHQA